MIYRILFIALYLLLSNFNSFSQDEIDIVDPYQMKVSRSKDADTFYFSQNPTNITINKNKLDTLRSYDVFLEERMTPFGIAYMCNGTEITKKKYLEYKQFWNATGACKPCLLYTYDDKDQLKYVAYQYQDCLCGSYTEYYKDGKLKVEGQFLNVVSDNWQNINDRKVCNKRDGNWTYYLPNGVVEKTELYASGILKNTTTPAIIITSVKQSSIPNTNNLEEENTTPKKGLFKRLKEKNNLSETE